MTRTLVVLGGGPLAAPALRFAREAGLAVVLADPDPRARARHLADEHHVLPRGDADAHRALVTRVARTGRLAGVHATDAAGAAGHALLPALAAAAAGVLPPPTVLAALARDGGRARLDAAGLALAPRDASDTLLVQGYFRDGAFVPGAVARRTVLDGGDVVGCLPGLASAAGARAVQALAERAARAAGLVEGPFQVTLAETTAGLALVRVDAGFPVALLATHVAPLALEKSPLQAWCAHLAGAGGPFDELPQAAHAHAGWLEVRAAQPGVLGAIDGTAAARAVPGVTALWTADPGRELDGTVAPEPLALAVASGFDAEELEGRLRRARAALEVRIACLRVA